MILFALDWSPNQGVLCIEKSIKEGQGPIRTVEVSWKKKWYCTCIPDLQEMYEYITKEIYACTYQLF
jgi:hypothetical protein